MAQSCETFSAYGEQKSVWAIMRSVWIEGHRVFPQSTRENVRGYFLERTSFVSGSFEERLFVLYMEARINIIELGRVI